MVKECHIPIDLTNIRPDEHYCDIWKRVYKTSRKMGVLVFRNIKSVGHIHRVNFVEVG